MKKWFFILIFILTSCVSQKTPEKKEWSINPNWKGFTDSIIDLEENVEEKKLVGNREPASTEPLVIVEPMEIVIEKNRTIKSSQQSELGQIIYKVPDTMSVGTNYQIIVRISKSQTNIEINDGLGNNVIKKSIRTSDRMQVQLKDPTEKNFKIVEINSEDQIVDSTYTEWRFNVIPQKSGHNQLLLVVSIFKGQDLKQIVYSDDIWVKTNAKVQISNFWSNYWQWSMDKILIPIITFLFGLWWSKRRKKE